MTLHRHQNTYVCVSLGLSFGVFELAADKYAAVQLFGAHDANVGSTQEVTFSVASIQASSVNTSISTAAYKRYAFTDSGERRFITTYTAIIHVTSGVVDSIEFDEGCMLCGSLSPQCVGSGLAVDALHPVPDYQTNCYVPDSGCATLLGAGASTANSCDLKVFVVWTGTDAAGVFLTSANNRFSRYASFSLQLQNMWNSVSNVGSDVVGRLVNNN